MTHILGLNAKKAGWVLKSWREVRLRELLGVTSDILHSTCMEINIHEWKNFGETCMEKNLEKRTK
jgi:hypothetical protein